MTTGCLKPTDSSGGKVVNQINETVSWERLHKDTKIWGKQYLA